MLKTKDLFDFTQSLAGDYLASFAYPWQALKGLKEEISRIGKNLPKEEYSEISPEVWVHKSAKIAPTAYLGAPCIIGKESEVRHCAFIRGSALVGGSLRGGQFRGTEKRRAVQRRAGAAFQLRGGFGPRM